MADAFQATDGTGGFSAVSVSVIIGLMLTSGLMLISFMIRAGQVSRSYTGQMAAVQIAEAGISKALHCLNVSDCGPCGGTCGPAYTGETDVDFGSGKFSIAIEGVGTTRTVRVTGVDAAGNRRTVSTLVTNIPPTDNPDFSFALQAGIDGIYMENNSAVTGSVYSNGNVTCQGTNAFVDGDAYVTLPSGKVENCTVNFHAHADNILQSMVKGDAYYKTSIAGSTVSGTTFADSSTPETKDLPNIDLDFWRTSAEAGGTLTGNYAPADNEIIGPKKIVGDFTLNNNVDVTLTGPIWVTGKFTAKNGSSITLDSVFGTYGSAILADHQSDRANQGKIVLENGSNVTGSGNPKSHVMLISTNTSIDPTNPAILVSNTSSGAIFLAPDGIMRLNNNAGAKSMAARKLYLDQNAVVSYLESDMAGIKFSNSPGVSWSAVEGSWLETN
ncbi:hypothetical protein JW899_01810 [Candidatus Uhrbacteria bacterium]|nr:hypothetical protein [Candidatus Uhrbacteria bacterium]